MSGTCDSGRHSKSGDRRAPSEGCQSGAESASPNRMTNSHPPIAGEEMKPCPFCGSSEVVVMKSSDAYQFGECDECGASGPPVKINDPTASPTPEESAIDAWNTRSPDVVTDEMIEAGIAESNRQAVGCASPEGQCRAIYIAMREAALLKVALRP